MLDDETIVGVADEIGATPSQVTLRWHLQRGDIVFPKSTKPERMRENFGALDVELSDVQMKAIDGLDRGEDGRTWPAPGPVRLHPRLTPRPHVTTSRSGSCPAGTSSYVGSDQQRLTSTAENPNDDDPPPDVDTSVRNCQRRAPRGTRTDPTCEVLCAGTRPLRQRRSVGCSPR